MFLYEKLVAEFGKRTLNGVHVPDHIINNLKYGIRPYQKEAFQRFILLCNEDFDGKPLPPYHLLYNMATGSGKTLVMAGLMLELYKQGYRNFLFFVDSSNIIDKTKDNFLNQQAKKYLFRDTIVVDNNNIFIKEINNFDEADDENINILFSTIQQLHLSLNNTKEGSVTYEDLQEKKIALIADEAHHINAGTKRGSLFGSWEDTVLKILKQNHKNILLEFTATLDEKNDDIMKKYNNKLLQKYDLAQFRVEGYSKEINLIRSLYDEQDRIAQALILNLYREVVATSNNINLKPVILFKAQKTIKESEENKENFHQLIDDFSVDAVKHIRATSTVPIVQKAFEYLNRQQIFSIDIVQRIKENFKEENCISANNDRDVELNQIRLNTLEDENNPIRAVFAVHKLNEGWDVLNLFDIVRLYETRDGKAGNPGKTTLSEAQLIGRGARYYPFAINSTQDTYIRKYDNDLNNDLRILEELYYHTKDDSRYIAELKKALVDSGIYEDDENILIKQLCIKEKFKETSFYKKGKVVFNKKIAKRYNHVKSFTDLGVSKKNFKYLMSSGTGSEINLFVEKENSPKNIEQILSKDVLVADIPQNIVKFALSKNPFFRFNLLQQYFPNIYSLSNFISNKNYLGGLEIIFSGPKSRLQQINNQDYLYAMQGLLKDIESDIKANLAEYEGSTYIYEDIRNVFINKTIKIHKDSERVNGQKEFLNDKDWYVYNANYGTSEEKAFVEMFARRIENLEKKYKQIYLIRNEQIVKIYDNIGRAFEPDFILFLKKDTEENYTYQVFIEPKGAHLKAYDKWKEIFLEKIRKDNCVIEIESDKYKITGVPFYTNENENNFIKAFEVILS